MVYLHAWRIAKFMPVTLTLEEQMRTLTRSRWAWWQVATAVTAELTCGGKPDAEIVRYGLWAGKGPARSAAQNL